MGKTNSKNSHIGKKVTAAYVRDKKGLRAVEDESSVLPDSTRYSTSNAETAAKGKKTILIFDNGNSIEVNETASEKIFDIDGFPADLAGNITKDGLSGAEYYSSIYEINGADYIYKVSCSIHGLAIDKNGKVRGYYSPDPECSEINSALKNLSKDNYIGKLKSRGDTIIPKNAYLFDNEDGTVLALWEWEEDEGYTHQAAILIPV